LADASRASATPAEVSEISTHSAPAQHYANALAPLLASAPKHDETPRKLWKSKSKRVRFGQHGRTQSETGGAAAERSAEGSSASEPAHSGSPPPPPPPPERASGEEEESRHAAEPALTKPAAGRRGSNTSTHSQGQNQGQGQGQSQSGRRQLKWKSRKHHKKRSNSDDAAAGAATTAAAVAGGSSQSLTGAGRE
jgi:hypothetical protein